MDIIPLPICHGRNLATNIQESFQSLMLPWGLSFPCWWWGQNDITIMRTEYQLIMLRQRLGTLGGQIYLSSRIFRFSLPMPQAHLTIAHIIMSILTKETLSWKPLAKFLAQKWSFYKCYLSASLFILYYYPPFSDESLYWLVQLA